VRDADKDQQPRLADRPDDLTVHGDARLRNPLHDCSHSIAEYRPLVAAARLA
jgi:hypothetical protein